jgi:hypothetical protein
VAWHRGAAGARSPQNLVDSSRGRRTVGPFVEILQFSETAEKSAASVSRQRIGESCWRQCHTDTYVASHQRSYDL